MESSILNINDLDYRNIRVNEKTPVDISGTIMGESPDCILLSGTVAGMFKCLEKKNTGPSVTPQTLQSWHNSGPVQSVKIGPCLVGLVSHVHVKHKRETSVLYDLRRK